jgi:hypothetical protein
VDENLSSRHFLGTLSWESLPTLGPLLSHFTLLCLNKLSCFTLKKKQRVLCGCTNTKGRLHFSLSEGGDLSLSSWMPLQSGRSLPSGSLNLTSSKVLEVRLGVNNLRQWPIHKRIRASWPDYNHTSNDKLSTKCEEISSCTLILWTCILNSFGSSSFCKKCLNRFSWKNTEGPRIN